MENKLPPKNRPASKLTICNGHIQGSTPSETSSWRLMASPRPYNIPSGGLGGCYDTGHYRCQKKKDGEHACSQRQWKRYTIEPRKL